MLKIVAAAALAAYVVYDATTAPGLTRNDEIRPPAVTVKADRLPIFQAQADCSEAVWPYYPSDCLKSATLWGDNPASVRPVRFVTAHRAPANTQAQSFAQLEIQ